MKKIIFFAATLFSLFIFAGLTRASGQSKVFVAPMENNFNDFIVTAFVKNKVPVIITGSDAAADYIITGGSSKAKDKWYDTVFRQDRASSQSPIKVIRQSDKSVVWAGSKSDKSFWSVLKGTVPDFWQAVKEIPQDEQQKFANKLAREIKKDVFTKNK